MFGTRWRRAPVLLLFPVAVTAVIAVAGCETSASHAASASPGALRTGPFSAAKLRDALLTRVNGVAAASPARVGSYSSLAQVAPAHDPASGAVVTPRACAGLTGLSSAVPGGAPAAAVTFRVGPNGVSEMLVASSDSAAVTALDSKVPAACEHYRASVDGKTLQYTVRESAVSGIGKRARVVNATTAGDSSADVWSIAYRGAGFVGTVSVAGPNASELAARELGQQAYAYAAKSLS
jgi:hypothetical protein